MKEVNYKSDFPALLTFRDGKGNDIGVPPYDWEARFWTASKAIDYRASSVGDVLTNCRVEDGRVIVVFNSHGLPPGHLHCEVSAHIPSGQFPDGEWRVVNATVAGRTLVPGQTEMPSEVEVEVLLPYIKGDKGDKLTFADLTAEEIDQLRQPAEQTAREYTEKYEQMTAEVETAKFNVFCDLWDAACGKWGKYDPDNAPDAEHPYYLNTLWLTYQEAQAVYAGPRITSSACNCLFKGSQIRTNIPPVSSGSQTGSTVPRFDVYQFLQSSKIEVFNLALKSAYGFCMNSASTGTDRVFESVPRLRKVIGPIDIGCMGNSKSFFNAPLLESVEFSYLNSNFNLSQLPKLNAASIRYLINHKYSIGPSATALRTVTVHPDVYAKLTDETNTEWNGLLALAAAKNIQFATV